MKGIYISIAFIFMVTAGCSILKSTSLSPKRMAFVQSGSNPGQVLVRTDGYGLEDLSVGISVFNGRIIVADNLLHRLQVIKPNGSVELLIGPLKDVDIGDIRAKKFNFGDIGAVIMDDDNTLYVQNKFSTIRETRSPLDGRVDSMDFSPPYVLVFNRNGELQYTLGQKGAPDTPFYHIERLAIDSKNRLFVISRLNESWNIFRFNGKQREVHLNLGNLEFRDRQEGNIFEGRIDSVKLFGNGERLIISVSYYHGLRLKYIKIFEYSIPGKKIEKMVMEIPDPRNVLFEVIDDKYLYLWNVSGDQVKFEVANLEGNVINNIYMDVMQKRSHYARILLDESGKIHTYHVTRDGVEIVKWE
ncbi:MAG: hypothetical protein E4G96_03225 [Chrysiogenales bacterium]|nr:MAG: hypothetical protein E4G96_03225 [Chrysiogenales bacterium]